jgi:WhiB family redox-sensing transcriptional regulator
VDLARLTAERRVTRTVPPVGRDTEPGSDWRHRAECVNEDPELFYPIGNTGPALLQIEDAKAVCRRCPVIEECLEFALDAKIDSGVFGGMSEDERRSLKRRALRARSRAA